jgi:hypothetical protein
VKIERILVEKPFGKQKLGRPRKYYVNINIHVDRISKRSHPAEVGYIGNVSEIFIIAMFKAK